jgi:photosystem II stability/assembly factor-like uncharacterized protein
MEGQTGARALVASGPAGLTRSTDAGATWPTVLPGEHGYVAYITFRDDTMGWAGSADGTRLLRTRDGGVCWERLAAPFGVRPLAALQALPDMVFAATYDSAQQSVTLWQSTDDGETWEQGAQAHTAWPLVASRGHPPLFTLGGTMFLRRADGRWEQIRVGGAPVRCVAGDEDTLVALTTEGIMGSTDGGMTWARDDESLPVDQIMDIALDAGTLYVLLAGGHVLTRGVRVDVHTQ